MTCQPRTSPRPEPVLATSAGWPPEGSAARAGWDRLVAVIHRHPLLTDVALAAIRRNPLLADAAVAAAVLALSVPQVITPAGGILVPALVLYTAQAVLLVFRRQYPFGVFWLIFVLVVVTADLTTEGLNGIALLVAFYTVAAYKPLRYVALAAVTLEAWAVLITFTSAVKEPQRAASLLAQSALIAAAGFIGYYARTRRAYLGRAGGPGRAAGARARPAGPDRRGRRTGPDRPGDARRRRAQLVGDDRAGRRRRLRRRRLTRTGPTAAMGQVSATGRQALAEMRRLLGVLREHRPTRAAHAPQPGIDDTRTSWSTQVRAAGLPTRLTVDRPAGALPPSAAADASTGSSRRR